jgi:hypothetical protein
MLAAHYPGTNAMDPVDEARARAVATYDSAADAYDDAANTFWDRFGCRTIREHGVREVQANVVYAVAVKPA